MAASVDGGQPRHQKKINWPQRLIPFGVVFGGLLAMALLYMGFDIIKTRMSPCESIFRQTAVALSTKLKFLKAEGELEIGHDKMAELSERAQMTALGLKTCCTVLDAGRLNPEEFLQCKSKARGYEARVEEIAALVSQPKSGLSISTAAAALSEGKTSKRVVQQKDVQKKVAKAIEISQSLNRQVVKVRKAQALESLEMIAPEHVDVANKEREPNDSLLQTNRLKINAWITGSIGASGESDFYSFTTPDIHRDWITVELQNRSTTLEPSLVLYDSEKTGIGHSYKTSVGADVQRSFVAKPNTTYLVKVSSYYGKSTGVYLLRANANKSYDSHEPNQGILDAKPVGRGKIIDAGIMDGKDYDFYALSSAKQTETVQFHLKNTSTTLHPAMTIYDANKNGIKTSYSTTAGADLKIAVNIPAGATYFVQVYDYYKNSSGTYQLSTTATAIKEKAGQ